ncbi:hypothetical protein DFH09DRAFT_1457417 [Mycena vulgaris]|nr:hypothetical protein DFH09DRAFT_1457417 [Mycena vulgaris]
MSRTPLRLVDVLTAFEYDHKRVDYAPTHANVYIWDEPLSGPRKRRQKRIRHPHSHSPRKASAVSVLYRFHYCASLSVTREAPPEGESPPLEQAQEHRPGISRPPSFSFSFSTAMRSPASTFDAAYRTARRTCLRGTMMRGALSLCTTLNARWLINKVTSACQGVDVMQRARAWDFIVPLPRHLDLARVMWSTQVTRPLSVTTPFFHWPIAEGVEERELCCDRRQECRVGDLVPRRRRADAIRMPGMYDTTISVVCRRSAYIEMQRICRLCWCDDKASDPIRAVTTKPGFADVRRGHVGLSSAGGCGGVWGKQYAGSEDEDVRMGRDIRPRASMLPSGGRSAVACTHCLMAVEGRMGREVPAGFLMSCACGVRVRRCGLRATVVVAPVSDVWRAVLRAGLLWLNAELCAVPAETGRRTARVLRISDMPSCLQRPVFGRTMIFYDLLSSEASSHVLAVTEVPPPAVQMWQSRRESLWPVNCSTACTLRRNDESDSKSENAHGSVANRGIRQASPSFPSTAQMLRGGRIAFITRIRDKIRPSDTVVEN